MGLESQGKEEIPEYLRDYVDNLVQRVSAFSDICLALSKEKDIDRLLEMIVQEARNMTNADGGTLYLLDEENMVLNFSIVQNDTLNVRMGGKSGKITWEPVKLRHADGSPNFSNVSAYVAIKGESVNIEDVYNTEQFDFRGTKEFDKKTGYRSKSMLVIPLRNHEDDIIGVIQLINAMDPERGEVIPFSDESERMGQALASQAAVALTNRQLIKELEDLFYAFIKTIASAIDEKSPYTAGHIGRVSALTQMIAEKINEAKEGPFKEVEFSEDQLKELYLSAWLHDVGKIVTPEYVVDKRTKLEGIWDKIELLRLRYELLKKQYKMEFRSSSDPEDEEELRKIEGKMDEEFEFLKKINRGRDFLKDKELNRLRDIAKRKIEIGGDIQPLLSDEELERLSVRRGTLTDKEREIINNHVVVTYKMLSQLPFPKKIKGVPFYASTHHERLDGSGYPNGLKAEQLPLQSRIIALADVFEALSAKDRPYKEAMKLSTSLKILHNMVQDNHIDRDLFELFLKEKIYLDYAKRYLSESQIDREDLLDLLE